MSKTYSIFITVLFCLFIGLFAVAHWIIPDRAFSDNENRLLEQMPTPVFTGPSANFFNAQFMGDFETYFTDQFPARDWFITVKAASELALGKTSNNNVYFGAEDTLFAGLATPAQGEVDKRLSFVDALAEKSQVPVYFSLVPDKLAIWGDRLNDPIALAPFRGEETPLAQAVNYDAADLWAKAANSKAHWVDLLPTFRAHAGEDIFYRTDHHWTSLGAYYGYAALMEAMGITPVPLEDYTATRVSDSFLGTTYSSSGAGWVKPDTIHTYVEDEGVKVTTYSTGSPEEGSLYVEEKLSVKDKYSYFLGGNTPLAVLETEHTDAPSVLIVRDSYSDSMAPFLTAHFSRIHLFDLRHNNTPITQYVAANDIDMVVVFYSTANFTTDVNLFKMGM